MKINFMSKSFFTVVFILTAFVAAAQQTLNLTFQHDGLTREYTLYIPAAYTGSTAVPLVFNLHGYSSNKDQQLLYGDFRPIADTANFIICLPNGTYDGSNNRFWNAGFGGTVDDMGFLMALLDYLETTYNIDESRVYSTGMSNGGFMSFTLACGETDRIAAIASVTGGMTTLLYPTCSPSRTIPVMQIHGTNDGTVPYNGSAQFTHIDTLIQYWKNHNGCSNAVTLTNIPNSNTTDGCTAERYEYYDCNDNTAVVFYKIIGGDHSWPGAIFNINTTNMDFSASLEIWKFFSQYTLPVATGINENKPAEALTIYPNPATHQLHLTLPGNTDAFQVSVFDLNGKNYFTAKISNGETIDVSNLSAGVYVVSAKNSAGVWVKKIIKE